MHAEQVQHGVSMTPEIGPFTFADLHGFKVAHYPLPTYYDPEGDMPRVAAEMERFYNLQGDESPFRSPRPEAFDRIAHRFTNWLNYGVKQAPQELYERWMGKEETFMTDAVGGSRLCMPGLFLHPVKE